MNKSEIKYMDQYLVKGPQVYIEPVTLNDVTEKYKNWLNDVEVNQYLETRFELQTLEKIKDYVSKMEQRRKIEPFFKICLNESAIHVGNIKLGPINPHHLHADVSLIIGDKNVWGKGVATQAIGLITYFGFEILKLNKLKAGCYAANSGSARAFIKNGYYLEGTLKEHVMFNNQPMDLLQFGITKSQYEEFK